MKTYKRIISTIYALTLTIAMLAGCGETAETPAESKADTTTTTAATEETTTTTVAETETPESMPDTEAVTEATESAAEIGIETMADNPEGMYPLEECFRRKAEEYYGQKVVEIKIEQGSYLYEAIFEDGQKAYLAVEFGFSYEEKDLFSINDIEFVGNNILGYAVSFQLNN